MKGFHMKVKDAPVPQWAEALEKGNRVRRELCLLKHEIAAYPMREGLALVADLLEDGELFDLVGPLRMEQLLAAVKGVNERKVGRFLVTAGCSPGRRVRDLTERQRLAIVTSLRAYGA